MKCIALTGGIATGKSTVARIFKKAGIPIVDSDQLARQVVLPDTPALQEVSKVFGQNFITSDGHLDRKKMADLIFTDEQARERLEAIIHPQIALALSKKLQDLATLGYRWVIYEVPLLFEKNMEAHFFATILVYCSEKSQLERLVKRDKISEDAALQRIRSQLSTDEKKRKATFSIDSDKNLDQVEKEVAHIWLSLTGTTLPIS